MFVTWSDLYNAGPSAPAAPPPSSGGSYQPLDADLTSIAAASATNSMYYRSAADTWGPVTIGGGLNFASGTLSASSSGREPYRYSTSTTPPVANGYLEANNATASAVTALYINYINNENSDVKRWLLALTVGTKLIIQDTVSSANYADYTIASAPVDQTTYAQIAVTYLESGGSISNNETVYLASVGAAAGGGGGVAEAPTDGQQYGRQSSSWTVVPAVPAASTTTPAMDGTGAAGSGTTYARADHVHPSDTSRMAVGAAPTAHQASHVIGTDQIPSASASARGLMAQLSGNTTDFVDGTNTCQNLVTAITPTITSVRLRSFNALGAGNCNFEVDQRNAHTVLAPASGTFLGDRWLMQKAGTLTGAANTQMVRTAFGSGHVVPNTNFVISQGHLLLNLTTVQATLAAGDYYVIRQMVEGPQFRELSQDVHSISLLIWSLNALKFSLYLRDTGTITRTLVKLCSVPANTWTLVQLPNLPIWSSGGNWSTAIDASGYELGLCFACGSNFIAPAADVWQNGSFLGAPGMDNWFATSGGSIQVAFVQHEPGAGCSQLMDLPFSQNLQACQRYFQKSNSYTDKPGTANINGSVRWQVGGGFDPNCLTIPFKCTMAKPPTTITAYSTSTGAVNTIRDESNNLDRTVTGAVGPGDMGFGGFNLSARAAATWNGSAHYTADTGW